MPRICFAVFLAMALFTPGCEDDTGPEEDDLTLYELQIIADSDTLLLLTGDTKTLKVLGVYVKTEEHTVTNRGVLTDTTSTYFTIDTTTKSVDASKLNWFSSDKNVATVNTGLVQAAGQGIAAISASLYQVESNPVSIKVSAGAPELIVDPPLKQLVFQNSAIVSGWVLTGKNLFLTLTMNAGTISYDSEGRFWETVNLELGINQFEIIATNNDNGLSTKKTKQIIYYPIADAGITGHWKGETLTRPFSFDISEVLGLYKIDGTLEVDLTLLGGPYYSQDVVILGLIKDDGTIDAKLSEESSGFTVTGTLGGVFYTTGTAGGSYTITIGKEGWPTFSGTEKWTAERQ